MGPLVGIQNAITCLSQCNCNPGVGIMPDIAWRQTLHCFSWEKTPLVERVSAVCKGPGRDVADTRGLDVDLISNTRHFFDNLFIKKEGVIGWILPSHTDRLLSRVWKKTCDVQKQWLAVTTVIALLSNMTCSLSKASGYSTAIAISMTYGDHGKVKSMDPSSWRLNKHH